jgi:hypothetical protein
MAVGHRTAELRSIELHRLIAGKLDEAIVERARRRVLKWLDDEDAQVPGLYARAWLELLNGPRAELKQALVEDSQRMRDLRQNTPFAGVLDEEERLAVIRRLH